MILYDNALSSYGQTAAIAVQGSGARFLSCQGHLKSKRNSTEW
jgi:hypothetical protein